MKILYPMDSTGESESALPCVEKLIRRLGGKLLLIQVTEPFVGMQPQYWQPLEEQALSASAEYLTSIQNRLTGLEVETFSVLGSPRNAIVEKATEEGCDLIVMTTHGRTGVARWLIGSIAESVLRQSPCPVLLLHAPAPQVGEFHRVLVPVDGSESSHQVLDRIGPFLSPTAQVTLLRCTDFTAQQQLRVLDDKHMESVIDGMLQELKSLGLPEHSLQRRVHRGDAVDGILKVAGELDCDLIAMSTHGRTGLRRFWLGSVAEGVARQATCPVLAFPNRSLSEE